MEDYNIYGWSAMHEACYKGYSNAVIRFLDYAKETGKNLIEQRTIDDFKTTPLLIASLGGHMEVIEMLVDNGADVNGKLDYRQNLKHGIIEIAAIKQHLELLVYMNDKIFDIPKRLIDLMLSEKIDDECRAAVGGTIEKLSVDYPSIMLKLSKFKKETHADRISALFTTQQIICYHTMTEDRFGSSLSVFFRLSEGNEESLASAVMILLNTIHDDKIRKSFIESKGISFLIKYMEKHKQKLTGKLAILEKIIKKLNKKPKPKSVGWSDDSDGMKDDEDEDDNEDANFKSLSDHNDNYIECASIGQALCGLSKFDDAIHQINNDSSNEKIISYVRTLFDWYNSKSLKYSFNSNETQLQQIQFEQYIGPYIVCLANLVHKNSINKQVFSNFNLYHLVLSFWNKIHVNNNSNILNSTNNVNNNKKGGSEGDFLTSSFNFEIEKSFFSTVSFDEDRPQNNVLDEASLIAPTVNNKPYPQPQAESNFPPLLIKNLKLAIIECFGKLLYDNLQLKAKYVYPYDFSSSSMSNDNDLDWPKMTNIFIKTLINYLDTMIVPDREIQLEVLRFISFLCDSDREMQLRFVTTHNVHKSTLINNFRNLLRKSSPLNIRTSTMFSLWTLAGDKDYREAHDRKTILYRAVGAQKFVDTLFDSSDELSLVCLEALIYIANGPPYRDSETNQLIKAQDDVAKVHAVPAVVRLFKSTNTSIIFASLKTLSAMCVTTAYINSFKNQSTIVKLGGLNAIIDIFRHKAYSNRLKAEAYYCLSMVCLNNNQSRKETFKIINTPVQEEIFIKDIMRLLNTSTYYETEEVITEEDSTNVPVIISEEELEEINTQLTAGLAFCNFCFLNEEFMRKIVLTVGRINWNVFRSIIIRLNKALDKSIKYKNKNLMFDVLKIRCNFGFQVAALHNLINLADEDPRALGIKMILDVINDSKNTYLRSIACDCVGRLIRLNDNLIESFMSINSIELLAKSSCETDEPFGPGESERGNAAVTLGYFTSANPEARRRLLKIARKSPKIMDSLKYSNEIIHLELVTQWKHYRELQSSIDFEMPTITVSLGKFPLPSINSNKHKTNKNIFIH